MGGLVWLLVPAEFTMAVPDFLFGVRSGNRSDLERLSEYVAGSEQTMSERDAICYAVR